MARRSDVCPPRRARQLVRVQRLLSLMKGKSPQGMEAHLYTTFRVATPQFWEWLAQHVHTSEGSLIADIGCGPGLQTLDALANLRGRYIGIDIDPAMIRHARQHFTSRRASFEVGDGHHTNLPAGKAVVVTWISSLHQMSMARTIAEGARLCACGGHLCVATHLEEDRETLLEFRYFRRLVDIERQRHPTHDALRATFASLGYEVQHVVRLPYMIRVIDEQLVQAIRKRYFSALHRLSDGEINEGCDRMTVDLRSGTLPSTESVHWTVFLATQRSIVLGPKP